MMDEIIARVAFALQDDGMTRLRAQRLAMAALSAIQVGDRLGGGMIVAQEVERGSIGAHDAARVVVLEPGRLSA